MNLLDQIKRDHDNLRQMLEKLEATTERAIKTRRTQFERVRQELTVHAHVEEAVLYEAIRDRPETRDMTLEGFEEHHVITVMLAEMGRMPVDTEEWGAKAGVLREFVEHHLEEEERDLFPQVRKLFDAGTLNELGERFAEARRNELHDLRKAA
ncbi:hemerythrin domain-containing protein [Thauera aminoaromatica]|uniref:hemerythrin domain-containing protein n=1 Tax=Thauera aminoaromatica TaxID=164330 RepID=UPI0035AFF388